MRFLIDAQLPPALAHFLEEHGHQATHVADIGLGNAGDASIWGKALESDYVIITKDEDFAERISRVSDRGPVIVWIRLGNTTKRALLLWFNNVLPEIIQRVQGGDKLIEIV